jgi:transcriptional regulator with XRE-family HTH domain
MSEFSIAVGRVLRAARRRQSLTLHDVRRLSAGLFKASALGAYERGERHISLERFTRLAEIYNTSAARLMSEVADGAPSPVPGSIVVHLDRLDQLGEPMRAPVAEFVDRILTKRGGAATETIILRAADMNEMAFRMGRPASELAAVLDSALEVD